VYYHFIGTKQEDDKLIFNAPANPKWLIGAEVTEDGQYVIIDISQDCDPVNLFYYCELSKIDLKTLTAPIPVVKLIDEFRAKFSYVTNEGTLFYLKSNLNAPKDKLIAIDLAHPEESAWKEIIPERENEVLSLVGCVNHDKLLVIHMKDICDYMGLYDLNGKLLENIPMPTLGTIVDLQGRKNQTEFFYKFSSFLSPASFFHYDFTKSEAERNKLFREVNVKDFDASEYETQQVFYNSKDGARIPMFLVHKKGLVKDGNNPTLLYGYGGFSISIQPYFSALRVVLLKHLRGVFAVANIRGGAEYGEEWHKAGTKDKKQNCFDDFCAAAEYLIDNKYSRPEKIAINGGSNGGLLVAACANQRPELFGVAVPQVGVLDMLKFHKFTIGYAWTSDYGCADNAEDFKYLIKYSPLHNVPKKKYPALLVTTADHDDRVSPLHSFKYISAVQHQLGKESFQTAPLLIRIETKAGHGAGKPTTKIIQEYADMYAFIFENLKLQWFDN
jgi:prolyl oligopeptidase